METLIEQARRLSSGTIATLTGSTCYDDIEQTQARFVEFCQDWQPMEQFKTWQEAWRVFAESLEDHGEPEPGITGDGISLSTNPYKTGIVQYGNGNPPGYE